ncbi:MAG: START domain-containing protein [Lewinellaceae bacterium]|nr:START domain-containing protein [Phaeodactylibacter sp.]MCB9352031.1 START domain-containing protein [Lewinellaceae bacterium]
MNTNLSLNILIVTTLLFAGLSLSAQPGEWKLKKEADGLKVYLRDAENSNIKEVKIEAIFDASLSSIITVLKDVPAYPDWIYKCAKSERMEPGTNTSSVYYCEVDFPWPLSDRDFVAKSALRQDPGTKNVYIDVKSAPAYLPEKDGLVRIATLNIQYEFIPLSENEVKMNYRLHSDPGGALPAWLVNMAVDNGPVNTIKGMREMLKQDKYKRAKLAFLME